MEPTGNEGPLYPILETLGVIFTSSPKPAIGSSAAADERSGGEMTNMKKTQARKKITPRKKKTHMEKETHMENTKKSLFQSETHMEKTHIESEILSEKLCPQKESVVPDRRSVGCFLWGQDSLPPNQVSM